MKIQTDLLTTICPDTWVARAYSEYLTDVAATQAELLSALTDAAADEELDTMIDGINDDVVPLYATIQQSIISFSLSESKTYDQVTTDLDLYKEGVVSALESNPDALTAAITLYNMNSDFFPDPEVYPEQFAEKYVNSNLDEFIANHPQVVQKIATLATNMCSSMHIDVNTPITLDGGYVKLHDLAIKCISAINFPSQDNFHLQLGIVNGATVDALSNVKSVFDNMKASLSSSLAWAQGFASLGYDKISDAVTNFDSSIRTIISDTTEKFASTVNTVRQVLVTTKSNVRSFFSTAGEMLGWDQVADDLYTKPDATQIFSYTGCSPLTAISIKGAQSIVTATFKTVIAAAAGIFNGAKYILSKLWYKVRPFVKALTSDPEDIEVSSSSDESYAIDNFKFSWDNAIWRFSLTDMDESTIEAFRQRFLTILENCTGAWYSIQTYAAEIAFKINQVEITYDRSDKLNVLIHYESVTRLRCFNYDRLVELGIIQKDRIAGTGIVYSPFVVSVGQSRWNDFLDSESIFCPDDAAEKSKFMGFVIAALFQRNASAQAYDDINTKFLTKYGWSIDTTQSYTYGGTVGSRTLVTHSDLTGTVPYQPADGDSLYPTSVSNLDFIHLACGYHTTPGHSERDFTTIPLYPSTVTTPSSVVQNVGSIEIDTLIGPLLMLLSLQQFDKAEDPLEYMFLPYCKGTYDFSDGRYHIKTDDQNANIANILATAIIIVAVVAATIFVSAKIAKIFKTKKIASLSSKIGVQDNAMWNGKKMNYKQARAYIRRKNKLDKLSGAGSGLAGSSSTIGSLSEQIASLANNDAGVSTDDLSTEQIRQLIQGV